MSVFTSCFKGVFSGLSGGLDLTRNALFQEEVDLNGRTLRVARLLGEGGYVVCPFHSPSLSLIHFRSEK